MKIKDILHLEKSNFNTIILHKEGMFYRAYEISAYLFTLYIKRYKVIKKFYKNVNSEVVYLGFPINNLDIILKIANKHTVSKQERTIIINDFQFKNEKFVLWKSEIEISEKSDILSQNIETKIINFPVANKTPIECQQFLIELQNELLNK